MALPIKRQIIAKAVQVTKTTAIVGAAVSLAMKVFVPLKRWRLRKIPGPTHRPLFGNSLPLVLGEDVVKFFERLCDTYNDKIVFKMWLVDKPVFIVTDPKLANSMLNQYGTRPELIDVAWASEFDRRPMEGALPFTNGDKWARGRRAVEESLMHASALNAHVPSMQTSIDQLLRMLEKLAASGRPVNIKDCCMATTLDTVTKAIFGVDLHCHGLVDSQTSPDAVLQSARAALAVGAKANASILTPGQIENGWWDKYPLGSPDFGRRFVSCALNLTSMLWTQRPVVQYLSNAFPGLAPLWRVLARVLPDRNARTMTKMMRGTRYGCIKLIDDWKARQMAAPETRQQGLMSSMMAQSSSQNMVDEVISMVFTGLIGGYDSTGNTLTMCLHYLSRNPEAQRKAQQEVDQVLKGKMPDAKDIKDMPYLEAVVKETVRLAPAVPFPIRQPTFTSEFNEPGGAFRIPAGSIVVMPLTFYHKDPKVWPRPTEFLPERFLPGYANLATDPEMFFAFGSGSRRCPGMRFALLQLRLALARVLQRLEFRPVPGAPEPVMRTNLLYGPEHVVLNVVKRGDVALL